MRAPAAASAITSESPLSRPIPRSAACSIAIGKVIASRYGSGQKHQPSNHGRRHPDARKLGDPQHLAAREH
jgi:hypothetical protein